MSSDTTARAAFESGLCALMLRLGAPAEPPLERIVSAAVDDMMEALEESAHDGSSLSPLDVVRIRANKLVATRVPAALFRDKEQLARMRAELLALAELWLGPAARRGSRFGPSER